LDRDPIGAYHTNRASGVRTVTAYADPATDCPCSSVSVLTTLVGGFIDAQHVLSAQRGGHGVIEPGGGQALSQALQGAAHGETVRIWGRSST
jgi:hypothetical protein